MMKKLILPVLFLLTHVAFSQDLMNKMSKDACGCIEKKTAQGEKDVQQLMQACVMEAMMNNMNEFMQQYGDAMQDPKKMESFGMELGMKLTKDCPAFMKVAGGSSNLTMKGELVGVDKTLSLEGTVESFKVKTLATITLVSNGVKEDFVILERFEGSENVFGKEKEIKGKRMKIEYKEMEIYNPSKKAFEKQKMVKSITMK
ncbi:MAG: hypothetical protein MUC49_04810 [Raineya sp.]|jgi:hypothetical protein|nr:hypothetical protein [Raineya sp.]